MNLLDLAHEIGLNPFKVSSTQGGEYKSPCPQCGGKDRFFIQPHKQMKHCSGYYRCRQCDIHGDAIQFAMDFKGMEFKEAAEYASATLPERSILYRSPIRPSFIPAQICPTPDSWQTNANAFVTWAHRNIVQQKDILEWLHKRGLPAEVIRTYKIGWNPQEIIRNKDDWGIKTQQNDNNKLWIPAGIDVV